MSGVCDLFQPSASSVPIIDPTLKHHGRLWINLQFLEPTKALRRWLSGNHQQPSLCLLYHTGQCNSGAKCNQAHVQPAFMSLVRKELLSRPFSNCCLGHGDLASHRSDFQAMLGYRPVELKTEEGSFPIRAEWIAITSYFDCYINEAAKQTSTGRTIRISPSRVCNLHQQQECKYGSDCRNIHLCRQFWASLPASYKALPAPVQGPIMVVPGHLRPPTFASSPTLTAPTVIITPAAAASTPVAPKADCHVLPIPAMSTMFRGPASPASPSRESVQPAPALRFQRPQPSLLQCSPCCPPVLGMDGPCAPPYSMPPPPTMRRPSNSTPFAQWHVSSDQQGVRPRATPGIPPATPLEFAALSTPVPSSPSHSTASEEDEWRVRQEELRRWHLSSASALPVRLVVPRSGFDAKFGGPPPLNRNSSTVWSSSDGETDCVTVNALTAEEVSSQGDCDFSLEEISEAEETESLPVVIDTAPLPGSYADVLAQQTIFQSLTFDLLDDSAVGIDLPFDVLRELQALVA